MPPRLRLATIATVTTFLAFAFQLIGVVSTPITRKISLAKYGGYQYGWGGVCSTDSSKECLTSKISIGYSMHNQGFWYIGPAGQKILTELLITHVVAAGCLLLGSILVGATHVENSGLRLSVAIIMVPFFLVTLMSFIVEILLFSTKLQFAGWFTLAASVLSMIAVSALFAQLPRTSKDKKLRGKVELTRGGSFVIGGLGALGHKERNTVDQERLIPSEKEPRFVPQPRSFDRSAKPFPFGTNQVPVSIPADAKTESQLPNLYNTRPLPRQPQSNQKQVHSSHAGGNGPPPPPPPGSRQAGTGNSGTHLQPPLQAPGATAAQPEQQKRTKVPAGAYVAGVDYSSNKYGPNVVGIPTMKSSPSRQQGTNKANMTGHSPNIPSQTAVFDYAKPSHPQPQPHSQPQSHSQPQLQQRQPPAPVPPQHTNVPNYSRLASSPQMGYMAQVKQERVEQFVSEPQYEQAPYYEHPLGQYPPPSPGGSESSHYTSVSQRPPRGLPAYTPPPPSQLRSDFVLANNPDFTLGGLPAGGRRIGRPGKSGRPSY